MNSTAGRRNALEDATAEIESLLERSAPHYPADLPIGHYARWTGWRTDLTRTEAGLVRYSLDEWARLPPLRRHLEVLRVEAEALLVRERLGEVILSSQEREELTRRALGILPGTEQERFREIASCPGFRPRHLARSAHEMMAAVQHIRIELGPATALAYGMFTLAGVRQDEDIAGHGAHLDRLYRRILSAHAVIQALDTADRQDPFNTDLRVLTAVREELWRIKPDPVSSEFLLTHIVESYVDDKPGGANSLGLSLLVAILLWKLNLDVNFLIEEGVMRLEVFCGDRPVYWDLVEPTPLSLVPIGSARPIVMTELFALAFSSLATLCFARSMWDRALQSYERALEIRPDSDATYTSIAACYLRKQMPQEAIQALNKALELNPLSAEACHELGNAHAMTEAWPKAVDAFKRAIRLRPDYAEVYNNLGFAYMRMGNTSQAVAAFLAAIQARSDYYQAHFNLGNLQLEQQQYDEAIKHYREAVRIEPGFVPALYNMGRAFYEKHDLDGAIHSYLKAVQLNPRHFGAWHNLGIAYRDKGMTQKAVEALEKAVTINPNLMR